MKKAILTGALRIAVSAALISILLYIMRDKYVAILSALKNADFLLAGLAFAVFVIAIMLGSFRLKLIVEAQGGVPVTFREILSLTFIGYFFNNFLPTAIGGDVAKGYYLTRKTKEATNSYTSVFVDRAIGLFTMIFMAFVALFFIQRNAIDERARQMLYVISAISIVAIFFILNKSFAKRVSFLFAIVRPIEKQLKEIYNAIHGYKHHTRLIAQSLVISTISQLLFYMAIAILAASIGSRLTWLDTLMRMPIVSAMSLLPSINGLGLREGSTVVMFGPIIGKTQAFALSIMWLLMLLTLSFIGGLIYAISPQFRMKLKEAK